LEFFEEVAKLGLEEYKKWQHYKNAAVHGSVRYMHDKFWIVCDFPTRISADAQNRSHSADGPSIAWSDGWKSYRWHGPQVPRRLIEAAETITVAEIEAEKNAELRRAKMERYGVNRYLEESGMEKVSEDKYGVLMKKDVPGDDPIMVVMVINSTPE